MNILHHKSWHVYNKDNIERVKRDEAQAEAEAKKKQDRVQLAEREARLELLRKKADARLPNNEQNQLTIREPTERFNLFEDLEKQKGEEKNEENEAEQKEKDKKWDRQITMYLDKGSTKEEEPWYIKENRKEDKYVDPYVFKSKKNKDRRHKRKSEAVNEDPLDFITRTLKKREEKRHKKEHHHRERSHSHRKEDKSSKSTPSIEELRAKRLARERNERARVKSIFMDNADEGGNDDELDERKRGYNSQYNRSETFKAKESSQRRY